MPTVSEQPASRPLFCEATASGEDVAGQPGRRPSKPSALPTMFCGTRAGAAYIVGTHPPSRAYWPQLTALLQLFFPPSPVPSIEHWYPESGPYVLQVFCRWLCQLLTSSQAWRNRQRRPKQQRLRSKGGQFLPLFEASWWSYSWYSLLWMRGHRSLMGSGQGTALPSSAACRQWKNGLHPCRLGWWMASTTRARLLGNLALKVRWPCPCHWIAVGLHPSCESRAASRLQFHVRELLEGQGFVGLLKAFSCLAW